MSMNLAKQTDSIGVEYLEAGEFDMITRDNKTAGADVVRGNVVKLDGGKVVPIAAASDAIYGVAAEDAAADEPTVVYLTGEFFADHLVLADGIAAADIEDALREKSIFLR